MQPQIDPAFLLSTSPMLARSFRLPLGNRNSANVVFCNSHSRCAIHVTSSLSSENLANSTGSPNLSQINRHVRLYDTHGLTPYDTAWKWQHELVNQLKRDKNTSDALILLEHSPVYTLGTRSDISNVLFDVEPTQAGNCSSGVQLVRTERGGEVTYHGPGQLVIYPVLNLGQPPHRRDLHWYARGLENCCIDTLGSYGIHAGRREGAAGVWVGNAKIVALGLKISKWITMHGLAFNVDLDMSPFNRIIPCGLRNSSVTSLKMLLGDKAPTMNQVKTKFVESFIRRFRVNIRNTFDPRFMRRPDVHRKTRESVNEQMLTV